MVKYKLEDFSNNHKLYAKYLDRKLRIADLKKKRRVLAKAYLNGLNCDILIRNCNKNLTLNKR